MPPTAAHVGRSLTHSLNKITSQDLHTRRVANVCNIILPCLSHIGPAGLQLYMFGSTHVLGLHTIGSDVDIVALRPEEISNGKDEDLSTEVARGLQAEFLSRLAKEIRRRHVGWSVEEVRRTRVPVIRVKGETIEEENNNNNNNNNNKREIVDLDITAHRRNGVRNSALLRAYVEQFPFSRWLNIGIKLWSKKAGINASVVGGSITSYGFNIMVVYYLLQRGKLQFISPSSIDVANVNPIPPYLPLEPITNEDGVYLLGEQVLDFLNFYMYEFDAMKHVISLSRPGITTKEELNWTKNAEDIARMKGEKIYYQWCIEDPYEINLNVGRNVTPLKKDFLLKHMAKARETALLTDI